MRRPWPRRPALLALLIVGLVLLNPFVWASTADFFLEGIHDAESDGVFHAIVSLKEALSHAPTVAVGFASVVAAVIVLANDDPFSPVCRSALPARAPPLI